MPRYHIEHGRGHVSCLHYSAAGDSFLVGGADGIVRQHSSADGRLIFAFDSGGPSTLVTAFAYTPVAYTLRYISRLPSLHCLPGHHVTQIQRHELAILTTVAYR